MEQFRHYHRVIWIAFNFQEKTINLIWTTCNETYGIPHPTWLKLLTRLGSRLSQFKDHKFNHNFRGFINPLCSCSLNIENNVHFFLHFQYFSLQRQALMNNIKSIDKDIINENDSDIENIVLLETFLEVVNNTTLI